MSKQEFLTQLREGLKGLPHDEIEERLNFYSEMIDDRIEDGILEDDAVAEVGATNEIVEQVISDIPLAKLAKERIKPKRRLKTWEIVLLVLGFPVWLPLLIAAFAVVLSVYVVIWAVVICLWAAFASVAGCAIAGVVGGATIAFSGNCQVGIAIIGAGIVCAGLSIFLFYGCKAATKVLVSLTKKLLIWVKNCLIKKGVA